MSFPRADPTKPVYVQKNPDGSNTYYQAIPLPYVQGQKPQVKYVRTTAQHPQPQIVAPQTITPPHNLHYNYNLLSLPVQPNNQPKQTKYQALHQADLPNTQFSAGLPTAQQKLPIQHAQPIILQPTPKPVQLNNSSPVVPKKSDSVISKRLAGETNVPSEIIFFLNNKKQVVADIDPRTTLNEYIRTCYGHTGTKKVCGEVNYFLKIFF